MVSVKALIAKMLLGMSKMIVLENKSISNVAFSTYYGTTSQSIAKSGYTPIAIHSVGLNQALLHLYYMGISGNTAIFGVSRPATSGTISSLSITFTVVYIRTLFV